MSYFKTFVGQSPQTPIQGRGFTNPTPITLFPTFNLLASSLSDRLQEGLESENEKRLLRLSKCINFFKALRHGCCSHFR